MARLKSHRKKKKNSCYKKNVVHKSPQLTVSCAGPVHFTHSHSVYVRSF